MVPTATQMKRRENIRNMKGTCSHPKARNVARKAISIGNVTQRRVIITSRGVGGCGDGGLTKVSVDADGRGGVYVVA